MQKFWTKFKLPQRQCIAVAVVGIGFLILGGLGCRLYNQWRTLQTFKNDVQNLSKIIAPEEKLKLEKEYISLESALTSTFAQLVTGGFFFVTAYFTWRNLQVTEAKQITERFAQAITQLGSEKMEIRLGGIYALERIAKDSPKDYWTIIEVLSSFIREHSPRSLANKTTQNQPKETFLDSFIPKTKLRNNNREDSRIATDVQAALTVIGRRNIKQDETDPLHSFIFLDNVNLRNANCIGLNLSNINFTGTDFANAWLVNATLVQSLCAGTNFKDADFENADLRCSFFIAANCQNAGFINANLEGILLTNANLSNANFANSKNISDHQLEKAKLCQTKLPKNSKLDSDRDCKNLEVESQ
jgi:uncharacterized protein YjbI with pentapeptide repeats